jgi:hypothetical protein
MLCCCTGKGIQMLLVIHATARTTWITRYVQTPKARGTPSKWVSLSDDSVFKWGCLQRSAGASSTHC